VVLGSSFEAQPVKKSTVSAKTKNLLMRDLLLSFFLQKLGSCVSDDYTISAHNAFCHFD
jgi:hypothetical protein